MKLLSTVILLLLVNVTLWAGVPLNYTGYGDTSNIASFRADSLKYSKVFPLAQYENIRLDVICDDTSSAGRGSDSAKFTYFIEYGHPELDLSNKLDTVWSTLDRLVIGTFDALTATNFTAVDRTIASDGTYDLPGTTIDTLSFAVGRGSLQSRSFTSEYDVLFRVGFKGLTGNNKDAFLKLRLSVNRRIGMKINP